MPCHFKWGCNPVRFAWKNIVVLHFSDSKLLQAFLNLANCKLIIHFSGEGLGCRMRTLAVFRKFCIMTSLEIHACCHYCWDNYRTDIFDWIFGAIVAMFKIIRDHVAMNWWLLVRLRGPWLKARDSQQVMTLGFWRDNCSIDVKLDLLTGWGGLIHIATRVVVDNRATREVNHSITVKQCCLATYFCCWMHISWNRERMEET